MKFTLSLPNSEFTFPCSICEHNTADVQECKTCSVYNKSNEELYDIEVEIENIVNKASK